MNKNCLVIMTLILVLWACIQPSIGRAAVSPHLKIEVEAGGPFVDMFDFNMPDPCAPSPCSEDRVVVAKFVVDDTVNDLGFELRATTLTKYNVTPFSTASGGSAVTLMDNDSGVPAAYIYARFTGENTTSDFRIIKLQVRFDNNYDAFPVEETWKIQANPSPVDDHYYGFWADGLGEDAVETDVTKPKLINYLDNSQLTNFNLHIDFSSPTDISFGDVHINLEDEYLPDEQYQFRNVGTKALTIIEADPSSAPDSAYTIENYPSPPLPILPMAAFSRRITCQPTELGAIPDVNIDLTTDSSEVGTLELNLTNSTGIRLNAAILFDLSGSMLMDTPTGQQKVYLARLAALELSEFYQLLLPDGRLGLFTYPNTDGDCPSSQELIALNEIKHNNQSFKNHLDAGLGHSSLIMPDEDVYPSTPMAEGIGKVYEKLPKGQVNERNAVFHFGDGQHSCDSTGVKKTPADWYNDSTFQNAGIPFFTIPYGATGSGWLQTFTDLAAETNGKVFPADITDDLELQKEFKKALGEALDLETLKDPEGQIAAGASASHKVCVTESSHQVAFTVHWAVRNNNAIEVQVETPDHRFITPATAAASPAQVGYMSGETFAGYVVRGDYLRGGNGSGQWTLHLTGNVATPYAYQIYSVDRMKTEANFNLGYIGQIADLIVKIKDGTSLVREATVTAGYNMPTASFNNYLASTPVDPKLIYEAPETIGDHPATLAERKLYALTHFVKKPFSGERRTGKLTFNVGNIESEPKSQSKLLGSSIAHAQATVEKDRIFKASFKEAKYDGLYQMVIRVTGLTARAECFEREYVIARWADVHLSKALITNAVAWEDVQIGPFFDSKLIEVLQQTPPRGYLRKSIVLTPQDEAGNFFGIGRASEITFAVKNAEVMGTVVDNLDGSYVQVIQYKKRDVPNVTISASGVSSDEISIPVEPSRIHWVWILVIIIIIIALSLSIMMRRRKQPTSGGQSS